MHLCCEISLIYILWWCAQERNVKPPEKRRARALREHCYGTSVSINDNVMSWSWSDEECIKMWKKRGMQIMLFRVPKGKVHTLMYRFIVEWIFLFMLGKNYKQYYMYVCDWAIIPLQSSSDMHGALLALDRHILWCRFHIISRVTL